MIKSIIKYKFQKSVSEAQTGKRANRKFVNYQSARSVMILFESDYMEKNPIIKQIIRQLQADGKKVMAWGFVNKKQLTTAILPDFRILNKKNLDFFHKPAPSFLHELDENEFDLVIDLSVNEVIPLHYLALYSKAAFKAGLKKDTSSFYDFLIDVPGIANDVDEFNTEKESQFIFNQIIFYLKNIQTSD